MYHVSTQGVDERMINVLIIIIIKWTSLASFELISYLRSAVV